VTLTHDRRIDDALGSVEERYLEGLVFIRISKGDKLRPDTDVITKFAVAGSADEPCIGKNRVMVKQLSQFAFKCVHHLHLCTLFYETRKGSPYACSFFRWRMS